jgi:excinuclease ABC subunit A
MPERTPRTPNGWLRLGDVTRNNLQQLDVSFPIGGLHIGDRRLGFRQVKSSLVSQRLVELVAEQLGQSIAIEEVDADDLEQTIVTTGGEIVSGVEQIGRMVVVDQKPIGRTPRSNMPLTLPL